MTDNSSTGNITSTGESGKAGGLIGHVEDDPWSYQNCTSSGALHGSRTGSVCGWDGYQKKSVGTSGSMTSSVFSGGSLPAIVGCACLLLGFAGGLLLGRKQKAAGIGSDSSETEEAESLR